METVNPAESPHCATCGAELVEDAAVWCPRCGAAVLPEAICWDVAPSASQPGVKRSDQTMDLAKVDTAAASDSQPVDESPGRLGWRARVPRLKGRRAVLAVVAVSVVVLACVAVGGFFAIRDAVTSAATLFPVTLTDASGANKVGYIDKGGAMVIELGAFSESAGSSFVEGLAQVFVGDKAGFIDTKGRVVIQPRFSGTNGFKEGRALVWLADGCAYIDKKGAYVVPPGLYSDGHDFSEGLAAVAVTEGDQIRYGYVDRSGTLAIKPQFVAAGEFSEGLAPAEVVDEKGRSQWGYIDTTGRWVIVPQFEYADGFSEGFAAVMPPASSSALGLWGYIDKTGAVAIPARFTVATRFSEGLAAAAQNNAPNGGPVYGYIDTSGTFVIPAQYASAGRFSGGLASVVVRDASGTAQRSYIDQTGKVVWTHAGP